MISFKPFIGFKITLHTKSDKHRLFSFFAISAVHMIRQHNRGHNSGGWNWVFPPTDLCSLDGDCVQPRNVQLAQLCF